MAVPEEVREAIQAAQQGIADAIELRDQTIIAAWKAGYSLREIAAAADMTHRAVSKLLERRGVRQRPTAEEAKRGNLWG